GRNAGPCSAVGGPNSSRGPPSAVCPSVRYGRPWKPLITCCGGGTILRYVVPVFP
ncbi:hypothetical protein NDU88_007105, partial [Pleurodeles waltl]